MFFVPLWAVVLCSLTVASLVIWKRRVSKGSGVNVGRPDGLGRGSYSGGGF